LVLIVGPILKRHAVHNAGKRWLCYYVGDGVGSERVTGEVKAIRLLEHEVATRMEERRKERARI
jgi:hypothetical protein